MFPSFQMDFLRWMFPSALFQAKELWWFTPIEIRVNILWEPGVCVLSCFSGVWLSVTLWTVATRLLCPWDSLGKNTGVGCLSLLQGIFPTQKLNWVSCVTGRFSTSWASREAWEPDRFLLQLGKCSYIVTEYSQNLCEIVMIIPNFTYMVTMA